MPVYLGPRVPQGQLYFPLFSVQVRPTMLLSIMVTIPGLELQEKGFSLALDSLEFPLLGEISDSILLGNIFHRHPLSKEKCHQSISVMLAGTLFISVDLKFLVKVCSDQSMVGSDKSTLAFRCPRDVGFLPLLTPKDSPSSCCCYVHVSIDDSHALNLDTESRIFGRISCW